jgi:hypothetical protein
MKMTPDALSGTCERLFALACGHHAGSGFVAETLLTFGADGAMLGTYVGAGSAPVASAVREKSSPGVVVADVALDQVPDLLRSELTLTGAVAAVRVHQVNLPDGGCLVTVAGAWPAEQARHERGARFDQDRTLVGSVATDADTAWLTAVLPLTA